jgi:hypothetical protein
LHVSEEILQGISFAFAGKCPNRTYIIQAEVLAVDERMAFSLRAFKLGTQSVRVRMRSCDTILISLLVTQNFLKRAWFRILFLRVFRAGSCLQEVSIALLNYSPGNSLRLGYSRVALNL